MQFMCENPMFLTLGIRISSLIFIYNRVSKLKNDSAYFEIPFKRLKEMIGLIFFIIFEMLPGKGTVYMNMWMMTYMVRRVVRSFLIAFAMTIERSKV